MYRGKTPDAFDYAINTLFFHAGVNDIPSPDCVSYRAIALSAGARAEECFQPTLGWREYMPQLFAHLGLKNGFTLTEACPDIFTRMRDGVVFILGEAAIPQDDMTAIHKFHKTLGSFLICEKRSGIFLISNPVGCVLKSASMEELLKLTDGRDAFTLSIEAKISVCPASKIAMLEEAIETERCRNQIPLLHSLKVDLSTSKAKAIFQDGLLQYIVRRRKIADFFGMSHSFSSALSDIPVRKDFTDFESIVRAERIFRKELETLWEMARYVG